MSSVKPAPRQVGTWQDAERLAADWCVFLGYADAHLTGSGPDGGVDVRSSQAIAQVKFKAAQVGAPDLQRLFGARGSAWDLDLLFFSGTSYSSKALTYAEEHEVSLFTYDLAGAVTPVSSMARVLLSDAERRHRPAEQPRAGVGPGRSSPSAGSSSGTKTQPSPRVHAPVAQCVIAGVLLFILAPLALVGFGALSAGTTHPGGSVVLGLLGLLVWLVALAGIASATAAVRRRSRGIGAGAVLLAAGPAIALWIALAIAFHADSDHPANGWVFLVVAVMSAPFVVLAIARPKAQGDRALGGTDQPRLR